MKRLVMMSISALTSVVRKNSWKYAKYFAILLISTVITVGCDKTIVEDEVNNGNNAKLKRISSIYLGFSDKENLSYKPFVSNPETI